MTAVRPKPVDYSAKPLAEMAMMDANILECPYHYNRALREHGDAVYRDPGSGVYVISRYDLCREAASRHDVFSSEFDLMAGAGTRKPPPEIAAINAKGWKRVNTLLTKDEPEHRVYRAIIQTYLMGRATTNLVEPFARSTAIGLMDAILANGTGRCEWIESFARPLPLRVIIHVLGLPPEEFGLFYQWTCDFATAFGQMCSDAELIAATKGMLDFQHYMVREIEKRRAAPREDVLNVVAHARYEGGRLLTMEECLSILRQLLVAGNETTNATLAETMRLLCLHPDQQALVRADRSLIPTMIEEALRLASPSSNAWRVLKADAEIGGQRIPKGSMALLKWFSSNHDEAQFEDAGRFDVRRQNARRHLAFGFGIHTCVGQHLSRTEMRVAWDVIFDRARDFRLAVDPGDLRYTPSVLLRALEAVPIRFESAS